MGPAIRNILQFVVKMVDNFREYHTAFGEFQDFTTYFRLMTKHGNSVKPKLITAQHRSCFTTCTILEVHQTTMAT